MVKYELDRGILKEIISIIKKDYAKAEWADDNTLVFKDKDDTEDGTITFDNTKVDIKGAVLNKKFKELKSEYDKALKDVVKEKDIKDTPLRELLVHKDKFNALDKNKKSVLELNKLLLKAGIKHVLMDKDVNQNNSVYPELTLGIQMVANTDSKSLPSGWMGRLKTFLSNEMPIDAGTKDSIYVREQNRFKPFEKEKVVEVKHKDFVIAYYYKERNLITLLFNPFLLEEHKVLSSEVKGVWKILFEVFLNSKIVQTDTSKILEKMFVTEFLKGSKRKIDKAKDLMKSSKSSISSYEKEIRKYIGQYNQAIRDIEFTQTLLDNEGKGLFEEVNKVKTLPFVEKLVINGGEINIKYNPSFIPIPKFSQNSSSKSFGKRYIWGGSIGFRITADDFYVYGDVNMNGHCHPHGSEFPEGSPCFGEGDGRNKIYDLLAGNKFMDLAKLLWFWIKTYRNSGAYTKQGPVYNTLLEQGYPIFDEKGVRIQINEEARIKSGEQRELVKGSDYAANIKKFKDIKLEA